MVVDETHLIAWNFAFFDDIFNVEKIIWICIKTSPDSPDGKQSRGKSGVIYFLIFIPILEIIL